MSELHDSELYSAATNALASTASANNTFEKISNAAFAHAEVKDFKKALKEVEKAIKSEYDLKSMPDPWRSAKSVILTALDLGLKLIDDNMKMKGKSYLQAEIKAKKAEGKEDKAPWDAVNELIVRMIFPFSKLDQAQKLSIKTMIADFE